MEVDLFAVVRDGVAFGLGVTSTGNKITIFIVTGEERVKVIIYSVFALVPGPWGTVPFLCFKILLDKGCFSVCIVDEIAVSVYDIGTEGLANLSCEGFYFLTCRVCFAVCVKRIINYGGEFFVDEVLDFIASIVDDAINAELEVCVIRTKELLEELL